MLPLSFLQLSTQFENAGDCLINRELMRLVAEHSEICLETGHSPERFAQQVASAVPNERRRRNRLPFYAEMLFARLRRRECYWFLMPGAVIRQKTNSFPLLARVHDLALMLAFWMGVRICKLGASFGDLTDEQLAIWRRRRRWLFLLSPRDSISQTYLESRGIRCDSWIPDLSFNIFGAEADPSGAANDQETVACLSFRIDQYDQQAADVTKLAEAVCRNTPGNPRWRMVVQVARDRPGMEALHSRLQAMGVAVEPLVDVHTDVEACLDSYRGVSLVVSNRLHVLLMAASCGARVLALCQGPGGRKLEGLLRDLGLEAAIVDDSHPDRVVRSTERGLPISGLAERDRLRDAIAALFQTRPGHLPNDQFST
jgi:polysaccharide pyruvyl transferase WcaK-like protein